MFYREAGQFKTNYKADQAIFPILQDRVGLGLITPTLSVSTGPLGSESSATSSWRAGSSRR